MSNRFRASRPASRFVRDLSPREPVVVVAPAPSSRAAGRALPESTVAVLLSRDAGRQPRLLALSNSTFVEAVTETTSGERRCLAGYESAYLAMAALLPLRLVDDELPPSGRVSVWVGRRLNLLPEDLFLAKQFAAVYRAPGWDALDLQAILEWCCRVRLAVYRYLDAR